eukprot:s1318_g5.t1
MDTYAKALVWVEFQDPITRQAEEESAVADVPKETVDLSENGHDLSAPAAEKQPKLQAEATADAASLPAEDKEVVTTNTNKEPIEPIESEASSMANLEETKPLETAATARPKRKAKQVESKMVAESENLPKEVDEKSAEKKSEEEGKKKSDAAPKRPRAKRKGKKAEDTVVIDDAVEPCLLPDANGETGEPQHSEDCAMSFFLPKEQAASRTTVIDDAKAVANTVPDQDLVKDGDGLHISEDQPAAEAKADGEAAAGPLEGEAEQPDTAEAADARLIPYILQYPRRDGDVVSSFGGGDRRIFLSRKLHFSSRWACLGLQLKKDPDSPQARHLKPQDGWGVDEYFYARPDPLKEAEEVLSELLQQQALMCKEVRISIEDRLQEVFEEWRCLHNRINTSAEYCVRQVLDAVSQGQHADATTLGLAIEEMGL